MKVQTAFIRTGRLIKDVETGEVIHFDSINKAKKFSWEQQKLHGGLGMGCVQVKR